MIGNVIGVLFDGIAYGSLLFIIAVGLSVTLGLMNFVNLAHGAFAMVGGYVCVVMMSRLGVPFFAALPLAFVAATDRRRARGGRSISVCTGRSYLDQVLFSIGLVFMSIAVTDLRVRVVAAAGGAAVVPARADRFLGRIWHVPRFPDRGGGVVTVALQLLLEWTRFGSQARASVDNAVAAAGCTNVNRVFALTLRSARDSPDWEVRWHRSAGPRSDLPEEYMVNFLLVVASAVAARSGAAYRRAAPRRVRRRREQRRAAGRRLRHRRVDGGVARRVPGRPVRRRSRVVEPAAARRRGRRAAATVAGRPLATGGDRVRPFPSCRSSCARLSPARQPGSHHGGFRAVARSHSRLRRHCVARPCGVLRRRCVRRRAGCEERLDRSPGWDCWSRRSPPQSLAIW